MTFRSLSRPVRLGAAALLAAGGLLALGAPAYAADKADLAIVPSSFQLARSGTEAARKPFKFTVVNQGPAAATEVTVAIDYAGLDDALVAWSPPTGCAHSGAVYTCRLGLLSTDGADDVPAGARAEFGLPIWSIGKKGDAGSLTVTVASATPDPVKRNNEAEVPVTVVKAGYDLTTWASDVHVPVTAGAGTPGAATPLDWFVHNAGSKQAVGLTYILNLPAGAHFASVPPECVQQATTLDVYYCTVPDLVLRPQDVYTAPVTVTVDPGSTARLPDPGQVAAEASGTDAPDARRLSGQRYGKQATAAQLADVDDGDNIANFDIFAELVTATPSPEPSGEVTPTPSGSAAPVSPAPSGAPEAPGTGGGLPVTGAQVGLIGGVGAAVLALGGLLFVLSRRRKVVLVTPEDERSGE
ncbi:cell wall anchor protein [Plantactinospora sp. KBS50]|uniref:cell wall anchor protein n=1 Tax=Plantactinospora sp. KBS50 TaxID=2024580 RepID=UPI000BAAFCE0|nr:cell wall anchor protein [Plantactinospora sp. KBS50]ASW53211.1 hypothetical protein CIK06_02000 [Plantactinospora sp. KBS50]